MVQQTFFGLFSDEKSWPQPGTQCFRLLDWLKRGRPITPLESWQELGIYRLAARVNDLRNHGYDVKSARVEVHNRYGETCHVAQYWL